MIRLEKQCILLEMEAATGEAALCELADLAHAANPQIKAETINRVLTEREQLGSTGVGNGVAIPHARVEGLANLLFCFGRSIRGINFDAVDNRPVHLFVVLLTPPDQADGYLQSLAGVSNLLKDPDNRNTLLQATDVERVIELFRTGTK